MIVGWNMQSEQVAFFEQVGLSQLVAMYNLLEDTLFWVKDSQFRFVHANNTFIEHCGCHKLEQVVGKTDLDFSPPHLARQFCMDDERVMAGHLVNNRLEMNLTNDGEAAWYSTSKRPLLGPNNSVIGSYGITRLLQRTDMALNGVEAVKMPVEYIRKHYKEALPIEEVADMAHLSVSALERRFTKYLGKTPKQFINEVRLENARRLLVDSNMPIADIGYEVGFSGHSYFTKQFKLLFGMLPSKIRRDYQSAN